MSLLPISTRQLVQRIRAYPALSRTLGTIAARSETDNVRKIERLTSISQKFSANNSSHVTPVRLRGTGVYSSPAPPTALESAEVLKPLPHTRRMADSYVELDLPFSEDSTLRASYVGGLTKIRMGRLMEDFDSVAGASAYRYVLPNGATPADAIKYNLFLVTAAVDRMDLLRPLNDVDGQVPNLRISGHVSYATESSLEVFVRLSTVPKPGSGKESETILLGRFAMACRSSKGGKQKIAKLEVSGTDEEELWRMGKEMREGKQERKNVSLDSVPPNKAETKALHDLFVGRADIFVRNAPTPKEVVWMSDTKINSVTLMHPQERNVHNKVFGGYLMRLAYETAYSAACLFSRSPVTFLALDELRFAKPVEIGSLLLLDARVAFAPLEVGQHRSFHVCVDAGTVNLYTGEKTHTNTFTFTFAAPKPLQQYVLPRSYKQAMLWLDAQRRREVGISIRKEYDKQ